MLLATVAANGQVPPILLHPLKYHPETPTHVYLTGAGFAFAGESGLGDAHLLMSISLSQRMARIFFSFTAPFTAVNSRETSNQKCDPDEGVESASTDGSTGDTRSGTASKVSFSASGEVFIQSQIENGVEATAEFTLSGGGLIYVEVTWPGTLTVGDIVKCR